MVTRAAPLRFRIHRFLRTPIVYFTMGSLGLAFWYRTWQNSLNSQKYNSDLFKGILFHLRHDQKVLDLLGSNIKYDAERHPPVEGEINQVKGFADIRFVAEGEKGQANVTFKGRTRGHHDLWESSVFKIEKDGVRIEYD